MADIFDTDFLAFVNLDMTNFLLSTTKRYSLNELGNHISQKEYPYLYQFLQNVRIPQNSFTPSSLFTSSAPSTVDDPIDSLNLIDPTKLKIKTTGKSFNPFGMMKITLQKHMSKDDLNTLKKIYNVNDDTIPAGTAERIKTLLDFFQYMEQRLHLKEDKLDILYNHLMLLPSGPQLIKILLEHCENK